MCLPPSILEAAVALKLILTAFRKHRGELLGKKGLGG